MKNSGEFLPSLSDVKDKIKDRADLAQYVAKHTKLVKSSQGFKACCPLPGHKEKTPSFYVNTRDNFFYCYGCSRGGDVFSFLKLVEGLDFIEAIKELAQELQIELPKSTASSAAFAAGAQENSLQKSRRDKGYEILNRAALFFNRVLMDQLSPGAGPAYKYLKERGLTEKEMMDWGLGWAPAGAHTILNKLKDQSEVDIALAVGLVRTYGTKTYDFFQERLMIPIRDARGRTIAFSGRSLNPVSEGNPKYKNSPETEWFKKKEVLYGLDFSSKLIREENFVCFVEGYFDQWAFHRKDLPAVAVMGTSLGDEHLQLIAKHTRQLVLVMDTDQAGINSTKRSLPLLLSKGFDVKIFSDLAGKDPDDWLKGKTATTEQLRQQLLGSSEALDWWGRLVIRESTEKNLNRLQTLKVLTEVWTLTRSLAHKMILADEWGRLLNLGAKELSASLDELCAQLQKSNVKATQKAALQGGATWADSFPSAASAPRRERSPWERIAEEAFIFWLRNWEVLCPRSVESWAKREELFQNTLAEKLVGTISAESRRNHGELSRDFLKAFLSNDSLDEELKSWILKGLVVPELALPEDLTKILNSFDELAAFLERERVNSEMRKLQSEIRSQSHDPLKTAQLLQAVQDLRMNLEKRK